MAQVHTTSILLMLFLLYLSSSEMPSQSGEAEQQQEVGQVTPHSVDPTFADPLADAAEHIRQGGSNLPESGDLANDLAHVQHMIARQQQQQMKQAPQQPPSVVKAAAPLPAYMQLPKQSQATIPPQNGNLRPLVPNGTSLPQAKRSRVDNGASTNGTIMPAYTGKSSVSAPTPQATNVSYPRSYTATHSASAAAKAAADRAKGQAQIDRRRERNRILARRTRLRKKFFFESLQKDVADLQHENAALKSIVRSRLKPEDAHAVLSTCNANEKLPSIIHEEGIADVGGLGNDKAVKQLDKEDFNLIQSIQNSQQCFVITDPSLHDNPIVYASDDFFELTGYSQEEVLGRNCRFLQGTKTSPEKVAAVRKAVSAGEDCNVTMVNYTSNGKPFWNSLFIAALRDAENNIVNFIGVIVKVAGPEPGDPEYGITLS